MCELLDRLGIYYYRPVQSLGSRGRAKGAPDIYTCIRGKFICIEIKSENPKAKVSPDQDTHFERIRLAGGEVLLVRDLDLEGSWGQLLAYLREQRFPIPI